VPAAAFKDLCLDADDALVVGTFWSRALGGRLEVQEGGDTVVRASAEDRFPLHVLWINRVPEPKTVKNRVHLDVHGDPEHLVALGARVLRGHGAWTVLGDPEGNELCVFARPDGAAPSGAPADVFALCVDSAAPVELATWWQARLGGELRPGPDGRPRWLHGAAGLGDVVFKFVQVDEPRTVKNRCHWDVVGTVADFATAGARLLGEPGHGWTVMADPDGNEFCVF
jgi:hypothetical protein